MNEQEIQDWEREIAHAKMMQQQREKVVFADGKTYEVSIKDEEDGTI